MLVACLPARRARWRPGASGLALAMMWGAVAATELPQPSEGFLCCNLQVDDGWISDINQRTETSRMVPAGTPIRATGYGRHRVKVLVAGKAMELGNDYSRKVELRAFAQRYIVVQDPAESLASWAPEVREAVRSGQLLPGMSREQVVMSVGYPVADKTPDLDALDWRFWATSELEYKVGFDAAGRVVTIEGDDKALALVAPALLTKERMAAATAGEQPCAINVYRPTPKHWNTSRVRPFLYLDGQKQGTLGVGETYCLALAPGLHTVTIREAVGYLIPAWASGEHRIEVKPDGAPLFLRYTKDVGAIVPTGAGVAVQEINAFEPATEARWRNRD
jgi:hypothetical protein